MKTLLLALVAFLFYGATAVADQYAYQDVFPAPSAGRECGDAACGCQTGQRQSCCDAPQCGCEASPCDCVPCEAACGSELSCDPGCSDYLGCDSTACCDSGGCDSDECGFGGIFGSGCGDYEVGDPCSLLGNCGTFSMGGWVQLGYHTKANSLFNNYPDRVQLHQAWAWAEKALDTSNGFDIGGRVDYVYGTDGPDTQAFGTGPIGWDNDWDNGFAYGSALSQAYGEVGYGDLSVKVGHFYTVIGYEVVQAPDNFFYSHAYTFYNSEPFTHTGALVSYNPMDEVTVWGGYTLGWDSGFDDNGDNYLGGASLILTDKLTLTYASVIGRFGEARFNGVEKGHMNSVVADLALSDQLNYVFHTDYLSTEDAVGTDLRKTFDIAQYLLYSVSDCIALGARFEWYNHRGIYTPNRGTAVTGQRDDLYELTLGVNVRPHGNVVVRPEVRWDWDKGPVNALEDGRKAQTTFGIDSILLF